MFTLPAVGRVVSRPLSVSRAPVRVLSAESCVRSLSALSFPQLQFISPFCKAAQKSFKRRHHEKYPAAALKLAVARMMHTWSPPPIQVDKPAGRKPASNVLSYLCNPDVQVACDDTSGFIFSGKASAADVNMERAAGFSQVIHTVRMVRCTGGAHHRAPDAR